MNRIEFLNQFDALFNEAELQEIVYELPLQYDNLSGATKRSKIRSLIESSERNGSIEQLLTIVQRLRPQIVWPQTWTSQQQSQPTDVEMPPQQGGITITHSQVTAQNIVGGSQININTGDPEASTDDQA